jgi:prolyl-tRNA editing enzyme YbaK/EbsC (Cys-tRNA(Pro) deacylase)
VSVSADPGLGPDDVQAWCAEHGVPIRMLRPGVPTPTVPAAAAAVGVRPDQVLKSLVLFVDGEPRLVIAAGQDRLSYPRMAAAFGTTRRRVRLADADEAFATTGFVVGGMPPFGHRRPLPTWADRAAAVPGRTVVAGGGARDTLLEIATDDLLRVTGARVARLTDDGAETGADPEGTPA